MTSTTSVSTFDEPAGVAPRGTVILLPGRGEQPGLYRRFGARIAADGYRVRVLPEPTADPHVTAALLKEVLTDAAVAEPRVLAGVDAGALAVLHAAADSPAPIDALILVGLPDPEQDANDWLESWEDEVEYRASCPTHRGLLADDMLLERGVLCAARIPSALRKPVDLSALSLPVLGLHGDDDLLSPFGAVRTVYAALPEAQTVLVGNGRHDVLNSASHRSVAARVVQFLESLRAGVGAPPILLEVKTP